MWTCGERKELPVQVLDISLSAGRVVFTRMLSFLIFVTLKTKCQTWVEVKLLHGPLKLMIFLHKIFETRNFHFGCPQYLSSLFLSLAHLCTKITVKDDICANQPWVDDWQDCIYQIWRPLAQYQARWYKAMRFRLELQKITYHQIAYDYYLLWCKVWTICERFLLLIYSQFSRS